MDEDGIQPQHAALLIAAERMNDRGSLENRRHHDRAQHLASIGNVGAEAGCRHSGYVVVSG
jgi:hypothetical protein